MAHAINISIKQPEVRTINAYPKGFAIIPTSGYATYFKPEPNNNWAFATQSQEVLNVTSAAQGTSIGSFDISGAMNVTLGTLPYSQLGAELDGFKYVFDNFSITNSADLNAGDIVYFKESVGYNSYNAQVLKASTGNMEGAYGNLMIFINYNATSKKLYVMHKGYFDYETDAAQVNNWSAGRTIYLNNNNKIDITPATTSGYWIKSLGNCIPNTDGKKRIWFDPDTTYIKLR